MAETLSTEQYFVKGFRADSKSVVAASTGHTTDQVNLTTKALEATGNTETGGSRRFEFLFTTNIANNLYLEADGGTIALATLTTAPTFKYHVDCLMWYDTDSSLIQTRTVFSTVSTNTSDTPAVLVIKHNILSSADTATLVGAGFDVRIRGSLDGSAQKIGIKLVG